MSDVASAQMLMRGYVNSRPGSNLKQQLGSAANTLCWTYGRAKAVLYGEARVIRAREMEQLRAAAKRRQVEEITNDRDELGARLARMEEMLAVLVSQMASGAVHRERPAVRGAGGAVAPGNGKA